MRQIPFVHLFTSYNNLNWYICARVLQVFLPYGIYIVSWYGVHSSLRMRSSRLPLTIRFRTILRKFCPIYSTCLCVLELNTQSSMLMMSLVYWLVNISFLL